MHDYNRHVHHHHQLQVVTMMESDSSFGSTIEVRDGNTSTIVSNVRNGTSRLDTVVDNDTATASTEAFMTSDSDNGDHHDDVQECNNNGSYSSHHHRLPLPQPVPPVGSPSTIPTHSSSSSSSSGRRKKYHASATSVPTNNKACESSSSVASSCSSSSSSHGSVCSTSSSTHTNTTRSSSNNNSNNFDQTDILRDRNTTPSTSGLEAERTKERRGRSALKRNELRDTASSSSSSQEWQQQQQQQLLSSRNRSVSFPQHKSQLVQVRDHICLDEFSDEEYHAYWMSDVEQTMILDMADMTTALWSMGAAEDLDNHICYRGLEGKTPEAVEDYTDRYLDLVNGILWAQENCRVDVVERDVVDEVHVQEESASTTSSTFNVRNQIDHEQIADLYRQCTQPCQDIAYQRAQADEYDACMYYMEENYAVGDEIIYTDDNINVDQQGPIEAPSSMAVTTETYDANEDTASSMMMGLPSLVPLTSTSEDSEDTNNGDYVLYDTIGYCYVDTDQHNVDNDGDDDDDDDDGTESSEGGHGQPTANNQNE